MDSETIMSIRFMSSVRIFFSYEITQNNESRIVPKQLA